MKRAFLLILFVLVPVLSFAGDPVSLIPNSSGGYIGFDGKGNTLNVLPSPSGGILVLTAREITGQ